MNCSLLLRFAYNQISINREGGGALEKFEIESTRSTPYVLLDPKSGELRLKGDSYPEDAARFFEPILSWVKEYLQKSKVPLVFHVDLNYINSSSTKCLLIFFDILEAAYNTGTKVEVYWHYNEENDVAQEIGEEFKEDYKLPFHFKSYRTEDLGNHKTQKAV